MMDASRPDSPPPTEINPYDVLKLKKKATAAQIKTSYKKLALLLHPGKFDIYSADSLY
jgi:DnaJ family protein C protein 9